MRITVDEAEQLHQQFLNGDSTAGWTIVYSCTRLIASKVKRYEGYLSTDTDELVQEFYVHLFEKLAEWQPEKQPLNHFVIRQLNRTSKFCRRLACRPMEFTRCAAFAQDGSFDLTTIFDRADSETDELWADFEDAVAESDASPEGVEALRCHMLGLNLDETKARMSERFPGGENQWERRVRKLTSDTIAAIQKVTGTSSPDRTVSKAKVTETEFERIIRILLESKPVSYGGAVGLVLKHGITVSIGFTRDIYLRHQIKERRAAINKPEDIESTIAEIMAERRAHMGVKELPTAEEAEIPDSLWNRLEPLFDGRNFQDARARTNQVLYRLRNNCKVADIPSEFGTPAQHDRWHRKLRDLGLYDKVVSIAEDYYGKQ